MKKNIYLTALLLGTGAFSSYATIGNPIVVNEINDNVELIPSKFSANGSVSLLFMEEDNNCNYIGRIYSKDMQLQKTINVPSSTPVTAKYTVQYAKEGPVGVIEVSRDSWIVRDVENPDMLEDALNSVSGGRELVANGNEYYYVYSDDTWDFFYEPEIFGNKYPRRYYKYENNELYEVWVNYESTGWGVIGWSEPVEEETEKVPSLTGMDLYTELSSDIYRLYFTQHLFNKDDAYEYIMPIYETVQYSHESEWLKESGESIRCTGFRVMNESGSVIATVNFPSGYTSYGLYLNLIDLGDINYINIEDVEDSNGVSYSLMYQVDSNTNSVNAVSAPIRSKVFPTTPKAGTQVKVELGMEAGANTRVMVVSESGQTVYNKKVQPGVKLTSVDTSSFNKGMYVVVISDGVNKKESTKIIVR